MIKFEHQVTPRLPKTSIEVHESAELEEIVDSFMHFILAIGYSKPELAEAVSKLIEESK